MMFKRRLRKLNRNKNSFAAEANDVRYVPEHVPGMYSDASVWTQRKK
jgi:hypothetical protein